MADDDAASSGASPDANDKTAAKKRTLASQWRNGLRSLHRDAGFLVVGMTFVYALSGLAVNHIESWDPNFVPIERETTLAEMPKENDAIVRSALDWYGGNVEPDDVFWSSDSEAEVVIGEATLQIDAKSGHVVAKDRRSRFFLRAANWLHLNRGKRAWTYFADGYAILLLFLASSGVTMLKARQGILGRPGILLVLGIVIPFAFVHLAGP